MTLEEARGIAAQCWCDPETSGKVMDPELAEAFAKRLVEGAHSKKLNTLLNEENNDLLETLSAMKVERDEISAYADKVDKRRREQDAEIRDLRAEVIAAETLAKRRREQDAEIRDLRAEVIAAETLAIEKAIVVVKEAHQAIVSGYRVDEMEKQPIVPWTKAILTAMEKQLRTLITRSHRP